MTVSNLKFMSRTPEEKALALAKAETITGLKELAGWKAYTEAVQEVIDSLTPEVTAFNGDMAIQIASQITFVSGMKRALGIMSQQEQILKSLKQN